MLKLNIKIFFLYLSCLLLPYYVVADLDSHLIDKGTEETLLIRDFFNNVDLLKISTVKLDKKPCSAGGRYSMIIEGQIGPDARHAIFRLLDNLSSCRSSMHGHARINPVLVSLRSPGGYINEAYEIGKIFRHFEVTTLVESGYHCISSCAIAFLGGKKRILEDGGTLVFHSPHYLHPGENKREIIDCSIEKEERLALFRYFARATDSLRAKQLFERTMEHCSTKSGWKISSSREAISLGISTHP